MKVDLSLLDKETLKEIPLSLRIAQEEVNLEDLPVSVRYKISDFYENYGVKAYTPSDSYDIQPTFSEKNDFQTLNTSTQAILEYFKNYLETPRGSYPFDPEFGSVIKQSIQTKDTELRNTLLANDLEIITNNVNRSFDTDLAIRSANISQRPIGTGAVRYVLNINVSVENSEVVLEVLGD